LAEVGGEKAWARREKTELDWYIVVVYDDNYYVAIRSDINIVVIGSIMKMTARIKTALDKYIEYISQVDGVSQIYLFGSCARGDADERSDIDLMVIIDDYLDPIIKVAFKIQVGLSEMDVVSDASFDEIVNEPTLDIIVNNKNAFEEASRENFFQREVVETGVLLYAI